MQRRISSSRPITGSSLPLRASAVRSRAYFFRASYFSSEVAVSAVRPLRRSAMAFTSAPVVAPAALSASEALFLSLVAESSRRSVVT